MSHELTVEVSDVAFDAIRAAAEAAGATPAEIVSASIERQFAATCQGAGDISKWVGTMRGKGPIGLDNDQIDADLARAYSDNHETP